MLVSVLLPYTVTQLKVLDNKKEKKKNGNETSSKLELLYIGYSLYDKTVDFSHLSAEEKC